MDAGLIRGISIERRPPAFISSLDFHYELSRDFAEATCRVSAAIDGDARGTTVEARLEEVETGGRSPRPLPVAASRSSSKCVSRGCGRLSHPTSIA